MTKKEIEAEARFAEKIYENRAAVERRAVKVLDGLAKSRQVTIRLDNSEIGLAKEQAKRKGLPYQTYIKMLLHEALAANR